MSVRGWKQSLCAGLGVRTVLRVVVAGLAVLFTVLVAPTSTGAVAAVNGQPDDLVFRYDSAVVFPSAATGRGMAKASASGSAPSFDQVPLDSGHIYDLSPFLVAPNSTFSNLDPSDVPRVNGFQAINPNSLSNASGRFNYTVLDDGSLVVANRRYGHIDLANGGDVLAAGEVHIVNGQIRSINNASGHYQPSGSAAQSAAENAFSGLDLDIAPGAYREIGG